MAIHIGRREFIGTLGGAAGASPLMARGQHSAMLIIGLSSLSQTLATPFVAWGAGEIGFVECCSMADGRCSRLSPIASRLPRDASGGA
jgi:hypothetical protein